MFKRWFLLTSDRNEPDPYEEAEEAPELDGHAKGTSVVLVGGGRPFGVLQKPRQEVRQ